MSIGALVCVVGALCLPRTAAAAFTNVTAAAGLGDTGGAYSIAWADYDNDGHLDLWIADYADATATLYQNNGDGTFTATGECTTGKRSGAWGDYDNDGDRDLFASFNGYMYENNGDGTFTERASDANLVGANMGMTCWLDYDSDGDLDLFFPSGDVPWNEMRQNRDDGTFTTIDGAAAGLDNGEGNGENCAVADVDNDGDIDIYYNSASRATTNANARLYFNDGDGTFTEDAAGAGVAIGMGTNQPYYAPVFGDYDNDGYLDLFLGHPSGFANRLYSNDGDGTFTLASASNVCVNVGHSRGATWGDYDNDGDLDLLVGNEGALNRLYRNNGDGTFTDVAAALLITGGTSATKSVSLADYDNDGDLDIYYANDAQANVLFRNDLNDTNHLRVKVRGLGPGFSPRDGTGARVELYDAAGSTLLAVREVSGGGGYGSQEPDIQHFGLDAAWGGGGGTYTVKVRFTSGLTVTRSNVVPTSETIVVGATTLPNAIEIVESIGYPPVNAYTIGTYSLAVDVAGVMGGSPEWTVEFLSSPDLSRAAVNDKFTDGAGKAWKVTAVDDANDILSVIDSEGNRVSPAPPGSWWNTGWTRRRKITFDNSAQTEDLLNFPLLVKLDATRVDYSQTLDAGEDIRFVDADGATVLIYEIEKWDEGDASYVWVKVQRIDGGSSVDHIWVYYGNPSAADGQNAEDVWTANYKGVWHLHDDLLTSTWHANDGTNSGSGDIPGKIADGQDFPGTNSVGNGEYVNIPNSSSVQNIQENDYTRSAWFYPDTTPPGTGSDNDANYAIIAKPGQHSAVVYTNSDNFRVEHWLTTGQVGVTSLNTFPPGAYYHVVSVISKTDGTSKLYVNGQLEGTTTFTAGAAAREYGSVTWRIGCANPTGDTYRWAADGKIDEVRISNGVRSDDWVAAQYKSEGDTFCTYGAEETQASASTAGTLSRWFATIQAWEDAREGDLVARDTVEKGVCHDDSVFDEQVTISGSTTDADNYMWLTVAPRERHNGVAGAGVRIDRAGATNTTLTIADDYVTIEWLEICNDTLAAGGAIDHSGTDYVTYRNVMVHDVGFGAIRGDATSGNTTYINTVVYDAGADGLEFRTDTDAAYNCTVYNCTDAASGRGYRIATAGVYPTLRNCIAAGNTIDFDDRADSGFSASSSNNISTDATAPGASSQTGVLASALFVSVAAGAEDLHLKSSAPAVDAGADLSATFTEDIDGTIRPMVSGWDIGADEWNPEVFPAGTNYRSIGTNAGVLYATGTASVSTGSAAVSLGGGASLPTNVGVGDKLVLDPTSPEEEIFYILSRDSSTQLTVQAAAASDHTNAAFEIRRTFSSISLWEDAREGDLVAQGRSEVGVCYDDGTFTENLVIDGSTTDSTHYMTLTAAPVARHSGKAGTGVVIDTTALAHVIDVRDDYTVVEWLEITGWPNQSGSNSWEAVHLAADHTLFQYLLIHDDDYGAYDNPNSDAFYLNGMPTGGTLTIRNCIIYDIGRGAINNQGGAWGCTINIENCTINNTGLIGADGQGGINNSANVSGGDLNVNNRTVQIAGSTATFSAAMPVTVIVGDVLKYGLSRKEAAFIQGKTSSTVYTVKAHDGSDPVPCAAGTAVDVYHSAPPSIVNVVNTISVGSQDGDDFKNPGAAWGTCSNNLSSDTSAPGASPLTGKTAANQFVDVTQGSEDLHLKSGAEAIDAGADLSASFTDDIDGTIRPLGTGWDVGADEKDPEVFPAGTNFRSIGTDAGVLCRTGTASVSTGSTVVALGGGASLPTNVGAGDELILDPTGSGREVFYVLSRDSAAQLTVQAAAASTHADVNYAISRAYNALQPWEDAREGDLVLENRSEVGVCYDDGTFTGNLVIDGSATDSTYYMTLTAAPVARHSGKAGTGVVIDPSADGHVFTVSDDYVKVEWLEVTGWTGDSSEAFRVNNTGFEIRYCLIHDAEAHDQCDGIFVGSSGITVDVENCIFYDIARTAVNIQSRQNATVNVRNVTVYRAKSVHTSTDYCGLGFDREATRDNTGSVFNVENCYVHTVNGNAFHTVPATMPGAYGTFDNNASADATADDFGGTGNLINRDPANQFVVIAGGSEDLHLKSGAELIDAGKTLTAISDDIDGGTRTGVWDLGADEYVTGGPVTVNYRSIGTNAGTLYGFGTASVTAGTTTVTFGGGAGLPWNIGRGDELVLAGTETLYLLGRDSATQVTVQSPASSDHTDVGYTISRAYDALQTWEDDRDGNLIVDERREVGVCFNDGTFAGSLMIDGSATDAAHYMTLTAAAVARHSGKAGTGVVIDPSTIDYGIDILDNYTVVEWVEVTDWSVDSSNHSKDGIRIAAHYCLVQNVIVHDDGHGTDINSDANGVNLELDYATGTVRNSVVYNIARSGITAHMVDGATLYVENCTVLRCAQEDTEADTYGCVVSSGAGTVIRAENVIAMDAQNAAKDFQVRDAGTYDAASTNNLSSDDSAPGAVPLINKLSSDQFVSPTAGSEDLHLKSGSEAINAGADLSADFSLDVDGQTRSGTWDMGADEFVTPVALTVSVPASATEGDAPVSGTVSVPAAVTSDLTVSLVSDDTSEVTVPAAVVIWAGTSSATFDVTVVDDGDLDGEQAVTVTASAAGCVDGSGTITIRDDESIITLDIVPDTAAEGDGQLTDQGTVSIPGTLGADLVVDLSSSDTTELTVPASVTIPAGSTSVSFSLTVVDDGEVDGPQTVTVTASASGWASGSDMIDILDDESPSLTVSISPGTAVEGVGTLAGAGTVSVPAAVASDLTVSLVSNDTSEVTVPATVVISAGTTSTVFDVTVVDDGELDGDQTVTITASAAGYNPDSASFTVEDDEGAALLVTIAPNSAGEGDGVLAGAGTVSVPVAVTSDLTVSLSSDDTSEATVPATVVISAGTTSTVFDVTVVDDSELDGDQVVTITASAAGYIDGTDAITIQDDETGITLDIIPDTATEGDGDLTDQGIVSIAETLAADLVVDLNSSDTTALTVPASVTIPAGSTSVSFSLTVVDDRKIENPQTVTVTASAPGWVSGSDTIRILDDEARDGGIGGGSGGCGLGRLPSSRAGEAGVWPVWLLVLAVGWISKRSCRYYSAK